MIPVYRIHRSKNTKKYLEKVVDDNWYSHGGYFYDYARSMLKDRLGVKYVLLTNNGTTATHLLAKILKNKRSIKHIVTQNGSYVAAWNSFLFDGDMTVVMADLNIDTWNVDSTALSVILTQFSPKETAVLLVHNIGNPIEFNSGEFLTVEDNCEGMFGRYHSGLLTGTNCLASSVSFFANKNVTCGEGGAVVTNDEESYLYASALHGQGQSSKRYIHDKLGYNYRMTNLASAVLCAQLEEIDEILEKKNELFDFYRTSLSSVDGIHLQRLESNCAHSNWMFGMRIESSSYDVAEKFFKDRGVEIRPMFYPASSHEYIKPLINSRKVRITKEDTAAKLNRECVIIPSYPDLTLCERSYIVDIIKSYRQMIVSSNVTL